MVGEHIVSPLAVRPVHPYAQKWVPLLFSEKISELDSYFIRRYTIIQFFFIKVLRCLTSHRSHGLAP